MKKIICLVVLGLVLSGCATSYKNSTSKNTDISSIVSSEEVNESKILLLEQINVKNMDWPLYIGWILVIGLVMRIIMNIFKTAAVRQGEADIEDKVPRVLFSEEYKDKRLLLFWRLFSSSGNHAKLDDYFLPTILGAIELFIFPFAIVLGKWSFIAAWFLIKTSAHWRMWQESRTPFMRFLVGSALVILFSLFLARFLVKIN